VQGREDREKRSGTARIAKAPILDQSLQAALYGKKPV
jgi:hypothetical protein